MKNIKQTKPEVINIAHSNEDTYSNEASDKTYEEKEETKSSK